MFDMYLFRPPPSVLVVFVVVVASESHSPEQSISPPQKGSSKLAFIEISMEQSWRTRHPLQGLQPHELPEIPRDDQ